MSLRRGVVVALVLVCALAGPVACDSDSGGGGTQRVDLLLDFFPNADHAPIYRAKAHGHFERAGLDVRVRAPSDPADPIRQVAAGRVDLAVSYEPEVLRARDKGEPVVAVGALVGVPLTSIVSLPDAGIRTPADLRGKTVGTAGIDYQSAFLKAVLARAGVPESSVQQRDVGFNLSQALLSGRADAVLGAYWNYEAVQLRLKGKNPRVMHIELAGVPTYDELVLVANERSLRDSGERDRIRRLIGALAIATYELLGEPEREQAVRDLVAANPQLDPKLQRESIDATLQFFLPKSVRQPYGYQDPADWRAFTRFMRSSGLLERISDPKGAFTNDLLPPPRE